MPDIITGHTANEHLRRMCMKVFLKALIRGAIPFVIMTGISLIMNYQRMDAFQVKSTFMAGLIITAVAAASVIYDIDNWSLKKQSLVHLLAMAATVLPCLLLSGWFPLKTISDYLKVLGIFLFGGMVLWGAAYFIFGKLSAK